MLRKIIIYLGICILFIGFCSQNLIHAQLQYNGVKLISNSQTVPSGKVWKVESILSNQYDIQNISVSGAKILVNGNSIYLVNRTSTCNSSIAYFPEQMPMWLPAGTTLAPSTGVVYISVIEFNIVP
ncbi:MAG TPA: hypothetical protein P5250_03325 [Bacteroidales bacterium]|nr:hypothetical protein [Bacteroidales bacterium]